MKKLSDLSNNFSVLGKLKNLKSIKEEVEEIANKCEVFKKQLNTLNPTTEDYEQFGMDILVSALSYLSLERGDLLEKNDALLRKAVRSKETGDIYLETLELANFREDSLVDDEKNLSSLTQDMSIQGKEAKGSDLFKDMYRREFMTFMLNSAEEQKLSKSFILHGPSRSGKSFLSSYMLKVIAEESSIHNIAYINWNRLMSIWQMSFSDKTGEQSSDIQTLYKSLFKVESLILDDFGIGKMGDWAKDSVLIPLLTFREANNLKTGIITPYGQIELANLITSSSERKNSPRNQKILSLLNSFTHFALKTIY